MTPHVYGALSCLGVVGEHSCRRLSEPRGLLFHTAVVSLRTLAFSWQAGLQVSASLKNCEERDTVSGDAHLSSCPGPPC